MKKFKNEDQLRVKLGIPQEQFAVYLGVPRSQLAMYENGLRSLPAEANLKLADLEMLNQNIQQEKKKGKKEKNAALHPALQKHHDKIKNEMLDHLENCKAKKIFLQRDLNTMIKEYAKAETWSQLLDELLAGISSEKKKSLDYSWLELQKRDTLKKMVRHSKASQAQLQAMIHSFDAEAEAYKKGHEKL